MASRVYHRNGTLQTGIIYLKENKKRCLISGSMNISSVASENEKERITSQMCHKHTC